MNTTPKAVSLNEIFKSPIYLLAFGFGSGSSPIAPGTMGTLAAIPLYCIFALLNTKAYLVLSVLAFIAGIYICGKAAKQLGVYDHPGIVWDEIVGFLFTMFLVPFHWVWIILGFVLFRLFDIWKPNPIRWVEKKVGGGLGIMLDDLLAAIPAFFILQIASHLYTP